MSARMARAAWRNPFAIVSTGPSVHEEIFEQEQTILRLVHECGYVSADNYSDALARESAVSDSPIPMHVDRPYKSSRYEKQAAKAQAAYEERQRQRQLEKERVADTEWEPYVFRPEPVRVAKPQFGPPPVLSRERIREIVNNVVAAGSDEVARFQSGIRDSLMHGRLSDESISTLIDLGMI